VVNAKMSEIHDGFGPGDDDYQLLCECGREGCEERVAVPVSPTGDTERSHERFIVAPGHEQAGRERVLEARPSYSVVVPAQTPGDQEPFRAAATGAG